MQRTDRPVILLDGGLPGIVAATLAIEASPPSSTSQASIPPAFGLPDPCVSESPARARAVQRQVELLGLEPLAWARPPGPGAGVSRVLLEAGAITVSAGAGRLIWPVHAEDGSRLDVAAARVDRALLVSRLVALDASEQGRPDFRVQTPLADLSDAQVAELALDLDVPISASWWYNTDPKEHARWTEALRSVGWLGERDPASATPEPGSLRSS